jgi:rubrerythrin
MLSASAREDLLKDLRRSASGEKIAIARYGRRAAFAAKYSIGTLREYKKIIKSEKEHYNSFMREISRIKRLRQGD